MSYCALVQGLSCASLKCMCFQCILLIVYAFSIYTVQNGSIFNVLYPQHSTFILNVLHSKWRTFSMYCTQNAMHAFWMGPIENAHHFECIALKTHALFKSAHVFGHVHRKRMLFSEAKLEFLKIWMLLVMELQLCINKLKARLSASF